MNELTTMGGREPAKPGGASSRLPVARIDAVAREVEQLIGLKRHAERVVQCLEDYLRGLYGVHASDLIELDPLPASLSGVLAVLKEGLKPASRVQIITAIQVLHGLYGTRGDHEIAADVLVELIRAECPSVFGLHSAMVALLRPIPAVERYVSGCGQSTPGKSEQARKWLPTPSEIIMEVSDQTGAWACRARWIEQLPDLHARHHRALCELKRRAEEKAK